MNHQDANTLDAVMQKYLDDELMQAALAQVSAMRQQPAQPGKLAHQDPVDGDCGQQREQIAQQEFRQTIIDIAANVLKIPPAKMDAKENMARYGVDSIIVTEIIRRISDVLGLPIAPTIFFEARHLHELAEILFKRYQNTVMQHYDDSRASDTSEQAVVSVMPEEPLELDEDVLAWIAKFKAISATESPGRPDAATSTSPARSDAASASGYEPIAVIAMEGQFADSANLEEFERHLRQGDDCIREVPADRWDWQAVFGDPKAGEFSNVKYGGFTPDIDQFDPLFFGMSPKEAELMDPQHRLFIQCVWKLIESAGYAPAAFSDKKIGLFLGINLQDYAHIIDRAGAMEALHLTSLGHMFCPNRISFLLNIHGPSQVIDTACSSSLVALHRAILSIQHEGCEMAIAGGANLMISPDMHIMYSKVGMICEDGRCKTFSKQANGYVRGDGIGAVLLKKLSRAEADGDVILGVIKGSAENHGGMSTSLTAPNPKAQASLIAEAQQRAQVDPRSISYIECHGTGTSLGDPIEINGLKMAFEKRHLEVGVAIASGPYCGLGSVKSNIGHAETAAGIAGVIKVLLAMKYKRLYPSLHCDDINPLIELEGSPFYILQQGRDWEQPVVDGKIYPRRAGVSSFGAGGSNAHVVIEEYSDTRPAVAQPAEPAIIVLSAKNEQRLKELAARLHDVLNEDQHVAAANLHDIAYTLQVGRLAMEERWSAVVESVAELQHKLKALLDNRADVAAVYRGNSKRDKTAAVPLKPETLAPGFSAAKLNALAERWVSGIPVDWAALYQDERWQGRHPRRIMLPTYPFARQRHWIPQTGAVSRDSATKVLHPLLHQNTSLLTEQRFSSYFTGKEFFLADHVMLGESILPGVAYLEMARAALAQSTGDAQTGHTPLRLKQVVWVSPYSLNGGQPAPLHISLYPEANQHISYRIYSTPEADGEPVLHSQGMAIRHAGPDEPPAVLDLAALQDSITGGRASQNSLNKTQCYAAFKAMAMDYGPGHQALEMLYFGKPDAGLADSPQVLAKLSLPACVADTLDSFTLHPSVMDAALQACIGLMQGSPGNTSAALPFALQELVILAPCNATMWAWIRYAEGSAVTDKVQKLDIDLCDGQGRICIRMHGFSARVVDAVARDDKTTALLMCQPVWQAAAVPQQTHRPEYAQHLVMLCGLDERFAEAVSAQGLPCLPLQSQADGVAARYQDIAVQAFTRIKAMLTNKPNGHILIQLVLPMQGEQALLAGLAGLLKSAGRENTRLLGQVIAVDADAETPAGLLNKINENSVCPEDTQIRYGDAGREVLDWQELAASSDGATVVWKDNGVYLITGGAGGLGLLFAEDIAEKTQDATLVLTGRSPLSQDKLARLKALESMGARVEYRQADVGLAGEIDAVVRDMVATFGRIDGILHGAGILRDNLLANKTVAEFHAVFAPKVAGTVNLDNATQQLDLDFFVLFSSVAGALGSAGQADYAAANAFMDAYAAYRNGLVVAKQRHGLTLAVNWPLWQAGGMRMDAANEAMMKTGTGMVAMQTHTGLRALQHMLASGLPQVMVMEGVVSRMKQQLLTRPKRQERASVALGASAGELGALVEKIRQALLQMVSTTMKFDLADLDAETELSEYGFDSISFTDFANKLNQKYQLELAPTVFFEQPTIVELADYLSVTYQTAFISAFGLSFKGEALADDAVAEPQALPTRQHARFSPQTPAPQVEADDDAVAVIGMSGRFPMAEDLDAFWENLKAGRDCISEIPPERWDWQAIYGDPNKERNKTNIKWGGFIDRIGDFDAQFFGISPREAELMDPQQRLLMEYVWMAIEDAGYSAQSLSGSDTALFVGTASSGYGELMAKTQMAIDSYSATGVVGSVGPNRMSYFLNLHGPSEPIETACSSSLVAIHRALLAIKNGDCGQAIVGGINLIVSPETHISFNKAGMLCEDGRCKTFSKQANGYVRGEGVGMLFLKSLKAAEQAGDHIYGVIRGSAENHGGRANSLTAPNPKAQAELLKTAYRRAGIDPRSVSYIEAHGTGTELGDPIEVSALKTAFKDMYQATGADQAAGAHCGLGSVKTNIGHLELAAGVAGVIKVLLQLKHKTLVKSLHCDETNPYIQFQDSPFYLLRDNREWTPLPDGQGQVYPRRAGISSFGFGGVNAHLVIEEYPETPSTPQPNQEHLNTAQPCLIVLSAKDQDRLKDHASRLLAFIRQAGRRSVFQASANKLEQQIRAAVSEILQVAEADIGLTDSFADYGLDTVQQALLTEKLQADYGIAIPANEFRDKHSIALIAASLNDRGNDGVLVGSEGNAAPALADIAYTLQVGRVAMDSRLAFIAESLQELEDKLSQYLELGQAGNTGIYVGQARQNKEILAAFASDDDWQEALDKWIQGKKFAKLLGLWAKGLAVDWDKLYGSVKPKRISLPTYPFAKEHYWIAVQAASTQLQQQTGEHLHPLVHQNVSSFHEQCFKTVFTGAEFFLADHRIQGQALLPGVAYLEMARSAAEHALGAAQDRPTRVRLKDIAWIRPIAVSTDDLAVYTGLRVAEDGQIHYRIYTRPGQAEPVVHSQGCLVVDGSAPTSQPAVLDIADLQARITGGDADMGRIGAGQCYAAFKAMGVAYGPAHQAIETLYAGQNQVLAHLLMPAGLAQSAGLYVLHPSIMDAALQAAIGLGLAAGLDQTARPSLPFALQELDIIAPCVASMWAWVRYAEGATDRVQQLDIDLCDGQGRVCVRMRGFASRVLGGEHGVAQAVTEQPASADVQALPVAGTATLQTQAEQFFIRLLAATLKLPPQRIKADEALEKYGIDSILIIELSAVLEKTFGPLSKTLFFEYQTISELAAYFLATYQNQMRQLLQVDDTAITVENAGDGIAPAAAQYGVTRRFMADHGHKQTASAQPSVGALDIAIIGLAGRYPQAWDLDAYWQNLRDGKDSITEIPADRWAWRSYYTEDRSRYGGHYSKWGGFLDGVDQFDPLFFNISPREAEAMDPQERLFLEQAWLALEDAGYKPEDLQRITAEQAEDLPAQVGVYVGVMYSEYQLLGAEATLRGQPLVTSGSYASIANRVSYLLNLHGPSMTLDTMCSSSLTSLHLACQDLSAGRTDLALAGGVNVSIHPNKYTMLSSGQFISSRGHCESFGNGGDGYIPGEGVGVAVLKRLADAERDGDAIYGVIKGSAINHGGKTNGYSVPNPKAQQSVITQALKQAQTDARAVSYIEAHGTGTKLGDPIEITGLTKAFRKHTDQHQYCWLGSAKSNIGHCESAAGIAGVTKILLQMRHAQIAPSLHSNVLNPHIDFASTPFIVNQELRAWERPMIDGVVMPRIAGISSFGAGGSNAHLVIEEYRKQASPAQATPTETGAAYAVVLSAKTQAQLEAYAAKLLAFCQRGPDGLHASLLDLSYTLQIGRQAMGQRLGLLVSSRQELEEKLSRFLAGSPSPDSSGNGLYCGRARSGEVGWAEQATAQEIDDWIGQRDYAKLLGYWVQGGEINWRQLYETPQSLAIKPLRISLPTYPFAQERYWIDMPPAELCPVGREARAFLHPLLHENTSDLTEQRYSSTFTGQEFFLRDHKVQGQAVLPAVVYLEMALAAAAQATGCLNGGASGRLAMSLTNMLWLRPLAVNNVPKTTHIALFAETGQAGLPEIHYEIYTEPASVDAARIVHSQGVAWVNRALPDGKPDTLDIAALQAQLQPLDVVQCYQALAAAGIAYGPAHQALAGLYAGNGHQADGAATAQVLARLALPSAVAAEFAGKFMLHPSLADAALQATIGFAPGAGTTGQSLALPFALEALDVIRSCPANMWAWLRYSAGSAPDDKLRKLDIDLYDDAGVLCVRMRGYAARLYDNPGNSPDRHEQKPALGTVMLQPCWQPKAVALAENPAVYAQHMVMLCEIDADISISGVASLRLQSDAEDIGLRYQHYAQQLFTEIQRLLNTKPTGQVLLQLVVPGQAHGDERQLFSGLSGMLKTARLENPAFIGQVIALDPSVPAQRLVDMLNENSRCPVDPHIYYQQGQRWVAAWETIAPVAVKPMMPWKEDGVYLITGGAGGLGLIMAEDIAGHTRNVTLILTGRSALATDEQRFKKLENLGATVVYRAVDMTQKPAIDRLVADIIADYADKPAGPLNGIIHCAGITRDSLILKKSAEDVHAVLAPKVSGLVYLDQATRGIALDFFMLFSSVAGAMGNPGQADYAAANAFMDAYAGYRNRLATHAGKGDKPQGLTLSINWPLWQQGGMDVAAPIKEMMWRNSGLVPMTTAGGIQALYQGLATKHQQFMVLEGDVMRLSAAFLEPGDQTASLPPIGKAQNTVADDAVQEKLVSHIKNVVSAVLKLPAHRIAADAPLESYGVDSVVAMGLTAELEKTFGVLPKTLFFEYQTLLALSRYFLASYPQQLAQILGLADIEPAAPFMPEDGMAVNAERRKRFVFPVAEDAPDKPPRQAAAGSADIAVIGVAGRYPQANTLTEFWHNLKTGRDSVVEIPEARWDWQAEQQSAQQDKQAGSKGYCRWGSFLDGVDQFDPLFFNISPPEAEAMDPMERLFLETVWNLLESTGNLGETLQQSYQSRVGVYVGAMYQQYQAAEALSSYSAIANRVSYFFNFQGPSIAIDTMCSSSIVAVHTACASLLSGECGLAIAGGVNLSIHPKKYRGLSLGQMLGSHVNSTSFGDGDGYIPAEAVGAVLLKPLAKAIADGDTVLAVIKATSTNHGGQANGYAVPNPHAQASVITDSFAKASIDPRTVSYVESAANGSPLGDALELSALNKAFGQADGDGQYCAIGSVKSNIGHAEAASGMSQLTKVILQLQHQQLAPSIKAEPLNPNINFGQGPFYLQRELQPWRRPVVKSTRADGLVQELEYPRRALVNSFGAGGSNATLIIEEFIPADAARPDMATAGAPQLVLLSAKTPERLQAVVRQMLAFMAQQTLPLADLAYTLQVGRAAMPCRMALVVHQQQELIEKLQQYLHAAADDGADKALPDGCFTGDADEDHSDIKALLSGNAGQTMLQTLLAEKELARLGLYWSKGVSIPWHSLHEGAPVRRIALPTYPFAKSRYWLATPGGAVETRTASPAANPASWHSDPDQPIRITMQQYLLTALAETLSLEAGAIKPHKNLQDYGVNSIIALRIMRGFEDAFGLKMSGRDLLAYPTIAALAGHFAAKFEPKPDSKRPVLPVQPASLQSPLSEGQKGLWLLQKLSPETSAYNVPIAFRVKRQLDTAAFKQACAYLLQRHPLLRSRIREDQGEPYQMIPSDYALSFQEEGCDGMTEAALLARLKELCKLPFDLEQGPLMRVQLFSCHGQLPVVLITLHHIIVDGRSAVLLIQSLMAAYDDYAQGIEPSSPPAETGYYGFVAWERQMLASAAGQEHLRYWQQQLAGEIPPLALPTDYPRPAVQRFNGKTYEVPLSPVLAQQLKALAAAQGMTLSVVFLAAFKVLLYRYSGQVDIAVGMPTLGRPQRRYEDIIGYFINMIVIRSRFSAEQTFTDVLNKLRLTVVDGLDHAEYPFPGLVRELKINRDPAVAPLFQVSYAYQNFVSANDASAFAGLEMLSGIHQEGADDIGLEIHEAADGYVVKIDYNCDLFADSTIQRMMQHYLGLLDAVSTAPDGWITRYDFLSATETYQLSRQWNKSPYPVQMSEKQSCIPELFDQQAKKSPGHTAIQFGNQTLSYKELNKRSTQLARYLQKQGVQPNHFVGICLKRSPEMIIGMLAIMKAGAVYVPIDPELPEARIQYLLQDSQVQLLITQQALMQELAPALQGVAAKVLLLDKQRHDIAKIKNPFSRLKNKVQAGQAAYVIYTSGSTGKPKGVVVSHAAIARHCLSVKQYYQLSADDRILQFAPFSVDASLEQLLPGLVSGATIILRDEELWTVQAFKAKILEYNISVLDLPPGYLHELLLAGEQPLDGTTLRLVITGGEAIMPQTVELWRHSAMRAVRLINAYGPTETTVTSTVFDITAAIQSQRAMTSIPIGRPLPGETVYILDGWGNPVPVGVSGELHIGGAGLALGYLNQPALTREKFIDHPGLPGTLLYKTGDLARWSEDGIIEYLGRMDDQVKIRGFRVECGEIEAALKACPGVQNAVVLSHTATGSAQLVAYIVPVANGQVVDAATLSAALQTRLPGYMVPSSWVLLDQLPLTVNGKVDRNALRQLVVGQQSRQAYIAPVTETEQRLVGIWQELLGLERVGVHDNFFDMGGHSLLSVRLMAAIQQTFDCDLPLSALVQNPTIAGQARRLHNQGGKPWTPLVSLQANGDQPPFFCVHAAGGSVLPYRELALQLGGQRPFYGVESPGLNGEDVTGSIEELAARYIAAIRVIQPQGPYYLGGGSLGGVIAFEMARQLVQIGEVVALLALFDSYTPAVVLAYEQAHQLQHDDREILLLGEFARNLGLYDGNGAQAPTASGQHASEMMAQILEQAQRLELLSTDLPAGRIGQLFNVFKTHTLAMNAYKPQAYPGRITLFCTAKQADAGGWLAWAEGVDMISVPGDHYSLLQGENAVFLANELRKCFAEN
ncbi:MAG: amino acid adenylation domain-containing protein [Methylovulum sp.]|nr:amino acid adenylation domain-containing protein [Methylovulum sp.]